MVVFIEQALQWEEDTHFPETIGQMYAESTQHVRLEAQDRASRLAEDVRMGFLPESSPEITASSSKKPRVALGLEFRRWADMRRAGGKKGSVLAIGRKQRAPLSSSKKVE